MRTSAINGAVFLPGQKPIFSPNTLKALQELHTTNQGLAAMLRWFTAGGAISIAVRQLSQTWKLRHYDVIDDVITRKDREKRRPHRPMKSSKLSNGENRIALRQLLQNRK